MGEFRMPSLGADMENGTIIRWLVKPGDRVKRGDIVVEVETEKADMDVEIFEDGVVERLVVAEGESAPVGALLALLAAPGGAATTVPLPVTAPPTPPLPESPPLAAAPPRPPAAALPAAELHIRVTPAARALAEIRGVSLARLAGTGVDGRITREDVEAAAVRPAPAARQLVSPYARRLAQERGLAVEGLIGSGPGGSVVARDLPDTVPAVPPPALPSHAAPAGPEVARQARGQRVIGALMARAKREIPHYYLERTVNVQPALDWLRSENARRPVAERILFPALLLRAVALACADVPEMNGLYREEQFEPGQAVNIGIAIALRDGGLVTPALMDAANRPLPALMTELQQLVQRAREGRLRATEMTGGTITVTNLGDLGADLVHGVIYPPQVALVGFGRPMERPWAEKGMVGVRTVVTVTLAADHRVSNGHRGSVFLNAIARYLGKPEEL